MSDMIDKYTEIEFYYDLVYPDGRMELKSSLFTYNNLGSIDEFINCRIEAFKNLHCYVFQVAIRDVVKTTTKVLEYKKRGEQLEVL